MGPKLINWAFIAAGIFLAAVGWMVSFKIIAHYMGPEGVGFFGQFRQILQTASIIATYGGTNVLVQALASQRDKGAQNKLRVSLLRLFGLTGMMVMLVMIIFANELAQLTLSSNNSEVVLLIRWLTLAVLLSSISICCVAILNVYQSHLFMALAQSVGPTFLPFIIWIHLSSNHNWIGSFVIALIFCFGLNCFFGVWGMSRLRLPNEVIDEVKISTKKLFGDFKGFAIFNLLAVISSLIVFLIIRAWIIKSQGLGFLGLFEAGWALTFNYQTLFLTVCNTFYLPLLSGTCDQRRIKNHMLKTAYGVIGVSVLVCYSIIIWQKELINLLYSPLFDSAGELISILIIAIIFRGVSWVYGTLLVATRNTHILFTSELCLNLGILISTGYVILYEPSLKAFGWAFVVPHFLYLLFVIEYACHSNSLVRRLQIWPLVVIAVSPIFYLAVASGKYFFLNASQIRVLIGAVGLFICGLIYLQYRRIEE